MPVGDRDLTVGTWPPAEGPSTLSLGPALLRLGVTPSVLPGWVADALVQDGYAVIPSVLSPDALARLTERVDKLLDGGSPVNEPGARRAIGSLEDADLAICWTHPLVLAAAAFLIRRTFSLSGIGLRDPLPGQGQQPLHPDVGPEPVPGLHATWFVDDFDESNGATRVVPGSHRRPLPNPLSVTLDAVPTQVTVSGAAGSVLLRDMYLWHGGTTNHSDGTRRAAWAGYRAVGRESPSGHIDLLVPEATEDRPVPVSGD